jgi:hypothetical protein
MEWSSQRASRPGRTDVPESAARLRITLTGLISFAATEEEILLAEVAQREDTGDVDSWAALPTIVHTSEFRGEQVQRLRAIREGSRPPDFPRIEHGSPDTYRRYSHCDAESVWATSRATNATLIDETRRCADEDLLDPSRNPWLKGRQLWLQIIVRGFWHPTGHLADYYVHHEFPERALALHTHALATARYLGAPSMAVGMAHYSLACTRATLGQVEEAASSLKRAVGCNPDLRDHARSEPDLATLRETGRLTAVLG